MFSDIFSDGKTTEPRWFKNIRIIVAFGLTIAILLYISEQIKEISMYLKNEQYDIITTDEDISSTATMPDVYLCSANVANYSVNYFTGSPFYTNVSEYYDRGYSNKIQSDKEECILFQSGYLNLFPTLVALFDITLTSSSSITNASFDLTRYLNNSFVPDNVLRVLLGNITVNHNSTIIDYPFAYNFTFESQDCALINLFPTIKKTYKYQYSVIPFIGDVLNFLVGSIGYSPNLPNNDLNPNIQIFPKLHDNERIQFAIKIPTSIRHEIQITEFSILNLVSKIGGFYVAMNSIYILLFGMPKLSPWGILQKYVLTCRQCRRSFKTRLAKRYVSSSGIPLSQRVSNRRNNATLEDRVQMLETLLSEYYLDNYQWELLRKSILKYDRLQDKYNKMMNSQFRETKEDD